MGADDLRGGEFLRKQLYLGKRSQFKINNGYVSTVPGNCIAQLIQITGYVDNAEMVVERLRQHFRYFAVTLSDNYTKRFHERYLKIWLGVTRTLRTAAGF